jgi:CRP/FNR family transcriptional regulator
MDTLEDVAFERMDVRIAAFLVQRTGERDATLRLTHQEIADELGTAREVVSRVLEDLRARGYVRLARGAVDICDAGSLVALAHR